MASTMRRMLQLAAALGVVCLTACGGGGGGSGASSAASAGQGDQPYSDPNTYSSSPGDSLPSAQDAAAITHHQLTLNGVSIPYTATAGHLIAYSQTTGAPEASFFYVAYTADQQSAAQRPVTFFYNGGPGSSTVWLHMGSFAPKRLVTGDPSSTPPTPFPLVDNQESLLSTTDMVFVDAIGSGYSEAIAPNTNQTFWGVDVDAAAFRDFVIRYLSANQRQASPKFLFGESYGTTRTAVLSNVLEAAGVELNGVVIQSSILNYNTNCEMFNPGANGIIPVSCAGFVPSYGAVGDYYQLTPPTPSSLPQYVSKLTDFTSSQYSPAVQQYLPGGSMPPIANEVNLVGQLTAYTGLGENVWNSAYLNVSPDTFRNSLIPNTVLGAYDARVSALTSSPLAQEGEPSSAVITGPFTTALASFLPSFLGYTNASTYTIEGNANYYWNYSHDNAALPDVIPDLLAALEQNPKLKVLSLSGYHDLVTPFYQTELDLARLPSNANIQSHYYAGGHMIYLDDTSRPLESADVANFIQQAAAAK